MKKTLQRRDGSSFTSEKKVDLSSVDFARSDELFVSHHGT